MTVIAFDAEGLRGGIGWGRILRPLTRLAAEMFSDDDEASVPANPESNADADLPLVRRSQGGDLRAFDEIVARYQGPMTGLLFRFCRERTELEDLVQETFVRAFRALSGWKAEKPFSHWLKRIAVNVGLEFCRRNKRSPLALRLESAIEDGDPLEQVRAPDAAEAAPGTLAEAQWLLGHLPPDDRALLTLLYLDDMPLAEIAEHFGWSRANAKIRAFRARAQLRKILQRHGYTFS